MIAIVRDDIIGLDCYVEAEFKYGDYIGAIEQCGGYCFLDQIERLWADEGGRYLAKKMEDANLIKIDYFSRYKFVRLTANALKYLYYRGEKRDYSDIPKNKIPIQNLKSKPSEKVLLTSAMYFELATYDWNRFYCYKSHQVNFLEGNLNLDNEDEIKEYQIRIDKLILEYEKYNFSLSNLVNIFNNASSIDEMLLDTERFISNKKIALEEKRTILRKNSSEIDELDKLYENLNAATKKNKENINLILQMKNNRDRVESKINELKNAIKILQKKEATVNKSAQNIIDKLLFMRDVSKVVCLFEDKKLYFFSVFVRYHKYNYDEIIRDTLKLFSENNIEIKEVNLELISIFDATEKVKNEMEKLDEHYNAKLRSIFSDSGHVVFTHTYTRLDKLEKYFETLSDNISYIKDDHVDQFQNLREKLLQNANLF